jgi:hypothetical protein
MEEKPLEKLEPLEQSKTRSKWGGARPNSGPKPKADTLKALKKQFREYFTEEEIEEVMADVKAQRKEKPEILKMTVEQIFGKAPQSVNLDVNAQVTIVALEGDIKNLLHDNPGDQATEASFDALQDGGRQANDSDSQPVTDIQADSSTAEATSMVGGIYAAREVLDGCLSGSDESE